jgi:YEATS domain-containing protein 4
MDLVCDKVPFKVSETGWGEFTVQIRLQFVQESGEKPLTLAHPIKLHHWGAPVEGPPPTPASGDQPDAPPAFAVEKQEEKEGSEGVKAEVQTPVPTPSSPKPTTPIEPTPGTQPPDTPMASQPLEAPLSAGPVSIASKLPVHAWQYDELVFSDPPTSFLSILNANPPTPLPPKNRRARDQRQAHEVKVGQKAKGRTSSISTTGSRQGTTEPMAVDAPALPVPGTPGPGQAVVVGIPGEPGSADVPLEFSQEMEKGEWNRLNDARIKIVAEMDRWRWVLLCNNSRPSVSLIRE